MSGGPMPMGPDGGPPPGAPGGTPGESIVMPPPPPGLLGPGGFGSPVPGGGPPPAGPGPQGGAGGGFTAPAVSMERRPGLSKRLTANYLAEVVDKLGDELDDCDDELLRIYAVLALTKGEDTTAEDVHDAWSAWKLAKDPDHKSLVPFDDLDSDTKALDDKYVEAIHRVSTDETLDKGGDVTYTASTASEAPTLREREVKGEGEDERVVERLPRPSSRKKYTLIDDDLGKDASADPHQPA